MSERPGRERPGRERPPAYARAISLLGRRAHFRAELRAKLLAKGYAEGEVDGALDRLARDRYLDDERTARELVAGRLARGPVGRRKLAAELARKGAPAKAAAAALDELVPEDDREAAREAADDWLRRRGAPDPAALARHLERRGFSPRAIWGEVERLGSAGGAE